MSTGGGTQNTVQKLPLEGIRVIDFTAVWAGPHVTQWLAVMGAEVIKIESRLRPDMIRAYWNLQSTGHSINSEFAEFNYGKKGCTLNMTQPRAREIVRELVGISDIVTENFGGAVMDRWGLGYAELAALKPDIIMYAGSGFGRTGPYKEFPAFAGIAEAFAGLCHLNGYPGGDPRPMATFGYADVTSAEHGALAILAALHHREETGEGQYIDLSMTEVVSSLLFEPIMDYTMNGRVQDRQGNRDSVMAPHGCYRCRGDDEWVAIAVSSDEEWRAFCDAMGNPAWTSDERFRDTIGRWRNQDELDALIGDWTRDYAHYEVAEMLQRVGVMAGPSLKMEEVIQDPHLKERGFHLEVDHPGLGTWCLAALPWKLSDVPPGNYEHAPELGEHNDYVFGELLSMSAEEIARLEEEQVIY